MNHASHYIDGQWLDALQGGARRGESFNPATSQASATFAEGGQPEAEAALAAAERAFRTTDWRRSPRLRAAILLDFADRLEKRTDEIADWLVTLNGKLRREALGEIAGTVSELRYYAGLARNIFGRVIEVEPHCYATLDREAAGVAVIIVPWNAPVTLLVRSLAPAIAAGCTAVIKPAHQTALVHNMVLETLVCDARIPKGVVNSVIESGSEASRTLCASPLADIISFTGSAEVGKRIAQTASGTLARLSLELGGKAPAIVFKDSNPARTAAGVAAGALVMAGQQCTAIARVLVEESYFDEFAGALAQTLEAVRIGPGNDASSQMGCLIDMRNRDRIAALVDDAARSHTMHLRGHIGDGPLARGAFITPSLVEVEDLASPFIQNELFGPLLVIERFRDEADAVTRANATRYGLAASVWTRDATRARRVASQIRSGTVWANTHNRLFAEAETGGHHDSGYGRLHGQEGLNDFLATKHFYVEGGA
ncbi:Phenylacetaldehyde dehydrogenase [Pigmentiphaga humi]|uniref:Phenylacetaldehyde dehydrogenase n=1 Tax=Pigmentiphaga humi TaxID=2478468 RepID=A0A3P4B257_9BURK|nr:aldehyde dehydrogenase family protein [Pigmentiphaga humi]VCU69225.1 Phenylacetaldehyde dehydrogenase [Pigmentiphaga humi]